MNTKNHSGYYYQRLMSDSSDVVTFAFGRTFPFYLKGLKRSIGRLALYLVGFVVSIDATYNYDASTGYDDYVSWAGGLSALLFESCEVKNTLIGKPISHNYYRGDCFGLFGFIGNGMQRPAPEPPPLHHVGTAVTTNVHQIFIPLCSLLGLKGHHTAQLNILYEGGTLEIKTQPSALGNLNVTNATMRVTAVCLAEPELRLGPGTQFVRYEKAVGAASTLHQIEALGNAGSLDGVDTGAGTAFLAWMTSKRMHGGSFVNPYNLEYLSFPARGLDQLTCLDALYLDYLGACTNVDAAPLEGDGFGESGYLFSPTYVGSAVGVRHADFVPLISPKRYLELTKLQTFQGTQDIHAKIGSESFSGNDVFTALHYYSWTPARVEEVLRRIVDTGLAREVWQTNDLQPKTKLLAKNTGMVNVSKARYLPITWEPKEPVASPPGQAKS